MWLRFAIFVPSRRVVCVSTKVGVTEHIENKEYNMLRAIVNRFLQAVQRPPVAR